MENTESTKRLHVLDGVRGLAILLVFLTHVDLNHLINALPVWLQPVMNVLTSNGRTGVSIFFLLSGFLMAYLYPVVRSSRAFIQKRYTRILPLFISLVITRTIFRNFPHLNVLLLLAAIFIPAIIIHLIWVYGIKRLNNPKLSTGIFWAFIGLQLLVGGFDALWIMHHSPALVREWMITAVNGTLTLPFGTYIPMLDGVYWSLVAEMTFYLLYPFTFAPIAAYLQQRSPLVRTLFIVSLFPFIYGAALLSKKTLGVFIVDVPFFSFFVAGILLAYAARHRAHIFTTAAKWMDQPVLRYLPFLALLGLFTGLYYTFRAYPQMDSLIRLLSAIPIGLMFIWILGNTTAAAFLRNRFLTFLGTVSYSLYLVHTSIVDLGKKLYTPTGALDTVLFVAAIFVVALVCSVILYWLLEKPYFIRSGVQQTVVKPQPEAVHPRLGFILPVIIGIYLLCIVLAYQSNYSFFSLAYNHPRSALVSPTIPANTEVISLKQYPKLDMVITAQENNLGILAMNMEYAKPPLSVYPVPQSLTFKLREVGSPTWYVSTSYDTAKIGKNESYPFGFPPIADAKGKNYEVHLEYSNLPYNDAMVVTLANSPIQSAYQLNKAEIIKSPKRLSELVGNRIYSFYSNPKAQLAFVLVLPLMVMAAALFLVKKG